jgi:NADH-quinone oxidoreductase subunit M
MEYLKFYYLLSALLCVPICGALIIAIFAKNQIAARGVGLLFALINLLLMIILCLNFDRGLSGFQFVESYPWLADLHLNYSLGIDGISLLFVFLTAVLAPLCIAITPRMERIRLYIVMLLLLEACCIGVFVSLDLLLFFLFFEASLIPLFFIIGIWGGEDRVYASFKLLIYTLVGSVLFLLAILYIRNRFDTMNIIELAEVLPSLSLRTQKWLWLAFFVSFAIKIPMWPVHTWLPDAHVQAPTAGSVMLAGILIKIGAYGLLRFSLVFFPDASRELCGLVYLISIISIIYISLVAMAQQDIKKMIAYSSIAHMGFVTMGIFSLSSQALKGAIFQMLSHGLISSALFIGIGTLYERVRSRKIADYSGMAGLMPNGAAFFMLFTIASIGLPGTAGFIGEFLVMLGVFKLSKLYALLMLIGIVLGSFYMLQLYRRIFFAKTKDEEGCSTSLIADLTRVEFAVLMLLGIIVVLLGIYPSLVLDLISTSVDDMGIFLIEQR